QTSVHLNVSGIWSETGGAGIRVAVVDDGIEATHDSLEHAIGSLFDATERGTGSSGDPTGSGYGHGTAVAGIIAAESSQSDPIGIAPGVELASLRIFGSGALSVQDAFSYAWNFDIVNNSWGYSYALYGNDVFSHAVYWRPINASLDASLTYGRAGLGTVLVKSAGNSRADGRFATDDYVANHEGMIVVGAVDYTGDVSFYSTPGANILVSTPSSGAGLGVTTSDRSGFAGYSAGDRTDKFGGTSAAAPMVSGVVALMLDANPALAWQDVQDILALSARHTGSHQGAPASGNELYAWQTNAASNWNGGGMHFSNDYGFGLVDAFQAVRLAETWTIGRAVPDQFEASFAAANWSFSAIDSVATASFFVSNTYDLQSVTLSLNSNIAIEAIESIRLWSPNGTESILFEGESISGAIGGAYAWDYMSQIFRGEGAAGEWRLEIDFGDNGVDLSGVSALLDVRGTESTDNDVYYYTSEFSEFGMKVLTDGSGTDTINTAAIANAVTIDMQAGSASQIDGALMSISAETIIEQVVTGDGDDKITGNEFGNLITPGRGDDVVDGGGGNDLFVEGLGNDLYVGGSGIDIVLAHYAFDAEFVLFESAERDGEILFAHSNEQDTLQGIERIHFSDGTQVAFDNEGSAGQIYRLYETAFDRAPDEAGFEIWLDAADNGTDLYTIALSFVNSEEFSLLYNGFDSVEEKVAAFYVNSLGREAEDAGLTAWSHAYANQLVDDTQILIGFSESAENRMLTEHVFDQGFIF
ncbi:DUF4214 domain-containing protein, partial [Roseibium hamelinense]